MVLPVVSHSVSWPVALEDSKEASVPSNVGEPSIRLSRTDIYNIFNIILTKYCKQNTVWQFMGFTTYFGYVPVTENVIL